MNDLFFRDNPNGMEYSYSMLIGDIRNSTGFNPYCKSPDYYRVFLAILSAILLDRKLVLLDEDFSEAELLSLLGTVGIKDHQEPVNTDVFTDISKKDDLITRLNNCVSNGSVTMFTSGTTGVPKCVTHSFQSLIRFVQRSESHKKNVWGFAYNPAHMAGVQVFLQAVLNGNPLIKLFKLDRKLIMSEIQTAGISHISATPTFFRLMLPAETEFPEVRRISIGGEPFDKNKISEFRKMFPGAKVTNIYASTEAGSLFISSDDIFSIRDEQKGLVKIQHNELWIHKKLLGTSDDLLLTSGWYATGDMVEIVTDEPLTFRIHARKNEMINVGGNKVNPDEVEQILREMDGIMDARIYSKKNSLLGNIICCEVISNNAELTEQNIRLNLQKRLQEYKIPRMIRFVKEISMTRTGKAKRKEFDDHT